MKNASGSTQSAFSRQEAAAGTVTSKGSMWWEYQSALSGQMFATSNKGSTKTNKINKQQQPLTMNLKKPRLFFFLQNRAVQAIN